MSANMWYLGEGGQRTGPLTTDQAIMALLALPEPRAGMVWREGFEAWTPAGSVPELARKLPPPAPSAPVDSAPPVSVGRTAQRTAPVQAASHSEVATTCGICGTPRSVQAKRLVYGHSVCRSCYSNLVNRRGIAYVIDVFSAWGAALLALVFVEVAADVSLGHGLWIASIPFFLLKDGFAGRSPGKAVMALQVVDATSGEPTGFRASIKRNLALVVPLVPLWVALQLRGGARLGDGWAKTRVMWTRHRTSTVWSGRPATRAAAGRDWGVVWLKIGAGAFTGLGMVASPMLISSYGVAGHAARSSVVAEPPAPPSQPPAGGLPAEVARTPVPRTGAEPFPVVGTLLLGQAGLDAREYERAAELFEAALRRFPEGSHTIIAGAGCDAETLARYYENAKARQFMIARAGFAGPCYTILWGVYESQQAAEAAVRNVPAYLRQDAPWPQPAPLDVLLARQDR